MTPIKIPLRQEKYFVILLLMILLAILLFWSAATPPPKRWYAEYPEIWKYTNYILAFFSVFAIFFFAYNPTAIIIDDVGIKGYAISYSSGYIYWANIERVEIRTTLFTRILIVYIDAPKSYINKAPRKRALSLEYYYKKYGSPIIIKASDIKIDISEMNKILTTILERKL